MSLRTDLRDVVTLSGLKPKTLMRRVYVAIVEEDLSGYAAQLAYYFLFALFPFFIFLAALLPFIPIPDLLPGIMALIGELLPAAALDMIKDNVEALVSQPRGGLLSFGILLALWSASGGVAAITDSLNHAYHVKEGRPFWRRRGMAILLTMSLAVLMIGSMMLLIFGPELGGWLADFLGLGRAFDVVWSWVRWPLIVFMMVFAVALIYYFAPDVEQDWRWITPGSVIAVLAWIGVSLAFGYYVDNFAEYDKTYGSIGAVIVLLTWMYLSGFFLLVGGEINAEIEHSARGGKDAGEKKLPRKKAR